MNGGSDDFFGPSNSTAATRPVNPPQEEQQGKDQEQNFPINDALLVGNAAAVAASAPPESSSISYPTIDPIDGVEVAASVPAPPSPAEEEMGTLESTGADSDVVEQNLLKELAEMGFKQVDLNKEVLRMNSYDLQRSVDDLCGVTDWDPILEELQEMVNEMSVFIYSCVHCEPFSKLLLFLILSDMVNGTAGFLRHRDEQEAAEEE